MSVDPVLIERFSTKWVKDEASGCHLWIGAKLPKGYGFMKLPRERRQIYAHRLAYLIHYGEIPDRMQVCHRCDNPSCVNPEHLFVGSSQDNHDDMKVKGRSTYGERNARAKLTDEQVAQIRMAAEAGESNEAIAERFGIHKATVSRIAVGSRWGKATRKPPRKTPHRTVLSDRDVIAVRAMWEAGLKQREIAEKFGTSQTQISRIVRMKRRQDVQRESPLRNPAHAPLRYWRGN